MGMQLDTDAGLSKRATKDTGSEKSGRGGGPGNDSSTRNVPHRGSRERTWLQIEVVSTCGMGSKLSFKLSKKDVRIEIRGDVLSL